MAYLPARGDLVWLQFSPQEGHEQAGRRPALVLTSRKYNAKGGLAQACPITSKSKGYYFEVALPPGGGVGGVILADQMKSVDWQARQSEFISTVPGTILDQVLRKLEKLLWQDA